MLFLSLCPSRHRTPYLKTCLLRTLFLKELFTKWHWGAWPSCGQKYLLWVSICESCSCTGGRQGMEQLCACAFVRAFYTHSFQKSGPESLYGFIFSLHYPNMKRVVLKCCERTVYHHWCCVAFMSVLNFVLCEYTPKWLQGLTYSSNCCSETWWRIVHAGGNGLSSMYSSEEYNRVSGRCIELYFHWSCASACPLASTSPCRSGFKHTQDLPAQS